MDEANTHRIPQITLEGGAAVEGIKGGGIVVVG
jgi:hypothetical protein